MTGFDVLIIGSGPAGVSAAFPLLDAGVRVLMIDGGEAPSLPLPEKDFLTLRGEDPSQWHWMVGEDFHALKMSEAVSPKLRVPTQSYTFNGFNEKSQVNGEDFVAVGSLAIGGLSNSWGCGVAMYSASELEGFPYSARDLKASYQSVAKRMGISGRHDDDMRDYFGLDEVAQDVIEMDSLHQSLYNNYLKRRAAIQLEGIQLGRSRVAALSKDLGERSACNLSGNCMWGCSRRSLYSAADDLVLLKQHSGFSHRPGVRVESMKRDGDTWQLHVETAQGPEVLNATTVLLAAGTLASSRLVLNALSISTPVSMLSCPTAAFLLWQPLRLGAERGQGFGLGQLSYSLQLDENISGFGSTFSTTGIAAAEFVKHIPLTRGNGVRLLRNLMSSCVVGNLFLPGHLTDSEMQIQPDGSLRVKGHFRDEVPALMKSAKSKLHRAALKMQALLLPRSFNIGLPGADIHYAGSLPMKENPEPGQTNAYGEVEGMPGVFVVDGASLPVLSEKSHTLTLMANADRIGRTLADKLVQG